MPKDLFGDNINIPEKINSPRKQQHKRLVGFWCTAWENKYGQRYPFTARDGRHIYQFIEAIGPSDKIKKIIEAYLAEESAWFSQRGHKLGLLIQSLPRFVKQGEGKGGTKKTIPYRGYDEDLDLRAKPKSTEDD